MEIKGIEDLPPDIQAVLNVLMDTPGSVADTDVKVSFPKGAKMGDLIRALVEAKELLRDRPITAITLHSDLASKASYEATADEEPCGHVHSGLV